jgi:hypothetical protein
MSVVESANRLNDFVQASLENAMSTIRKIHQTAVEIPIDIGKELGLPADKADQVKAAHERILVNTYAGVRKAQADLGSLAVQQIGEFATLVGDFVAERGPGNGKVNAKDGRKTAELKTESAPAGTATGEA